MTEPTATIADALVVVGRRFYARGWVMGTSGNFSAVVSHNPLRLAITSSSLDKGALDPSHILEIGEDGGVVSGTGRPSAETLLHLEIVRAAAGRRRPAHALGVEHGPLGRHGDAGGFEHRRLRDAQGARRRRHPRASRVDTDRRERPGHAAPGRRVGARSTRIRTRTRFLLRRHGLYTWGDTLADAERTSRFSSSCSRRRTNGDGQVTRRTRWHCQDS